MWPPVRAPRRPAQRTSGAAAPDAAAGPRPYFYRVQVCAFFSSKTLAQICQWPLLDATVLCRRVTLESRRALAHERAFAQYCYRISCLRMCLWRKIKHPYGMHATPQAQAQSQVRGGHLATRPGLLHEGGEAAQARDAAEAFRRHVYVQGMYAKPLGAQACGCLQYAGSMHDAQEGPTAELGSQLMTACSPAVLQSHSAAQGQLPKAIYMRMQLLQAAVSVPDAERVPWPPDEAALGAAPPSMSEERRQQRLQAWVDRELRALLQSEDTAIVRAYVMGLVRGIGFSAASSSRGSAGQVLLGRPSHAS